MGTFICAISERDWGIAKTRGIYGNKEGNVGRDGTYRRFRPLTKYSIIRDLVGMKKGDKLFFHVVTQEGPSRVHGVYVAREVPFYDPTRIWDDTHEIYPFRFLFEPHQDYKYLCSQDANIEVIDFYELIEQRKIWSLATLENEMNIEARSVRKIEDSSESKEILRLLHRDYRQRRTGEQIQFSPIPFPSDFKPLRDCIKDIGQYENSIKALLMYKIGQNDSSITNVFGSISDFMNEVFIAQTTRKSIDILCIHNDTTESKTYIICEVKTDKCETGSLRQVLYYMDLFKRKELVNINSDNIVGCLIGKRFDSEVIDFSQRRNAHGINGSILLVKYNPINNNQDADFERIV